MIAGLIDTPSGSCYRSLPRTGYRETLRILDPCCGGGDALAQLAEAMRRPNSLPIETYGVELHRDRAEEAEGRLDRVLSHPPQANPRGIVKSMRGPRVRWADLPWTTICF